MSSRALFPNENSISPPALGAVNGFTGEILCTAVAARRHNLTNGNGTESPNCPAESGVMTADDDLTPWWEVKLDEPTTVTTVRIYRTYVQNGTEETGLHSSYRNWAGLYINVDLSLCHTGIQYSEYTDAIAESLYFSEGESGKMYHDFACDEPVKGQWVTVGKTAYHRYVRDGLYRLQLGEVQVLICEKGYYGQPGELGGDGCKKCPPVEECHYPCDNYYGCYTKVVWNVALDGTASQSSLPQLERAKIASNGIDRTVGRLPDNNDCAETAISTSDTHWWGVDLGRIFLLSSIRITTRPDCCGDRLNKFKVRVDTVLFGDGLDLAGRKADKVCADVDRPFVGKTNQFECKGIGQFVFVVIEKGDADRLPLCEVELLGTLVELVAPGQEMPSGNKCNLTVCDTYRASIVDNVCRSNFGAFCEKTEECLKGYLCTSNACYLSSEGNCTDHPDHCPPTTVCEPGLNGEGRRCLGVLGASCDIGTCRSSLVCDTFSKCRTPNNGTCSKNLQCVTGAACTANGVCECNTTISQPTRDRRSCVLLDDESISCDADGKCRCREFFYPSPTNDYICRGRIRTAIGIGSLRAGENCTMSARPNCNAESAVCEQGQCRLVVGWLCNPDKDYCISRSFCKRGMVVTDVCAVKRGHRCHDREQVDYGSRCALDNVARLTAGQNCTENPSLCSVLAECGKSDGLCEKVAGTAPCRRGCGTGLICQRQFCRLPVGRGCYWDTQCVQGALCTDGKCVCSKQSNERTQLCEPRPLQAGSTCNQSDDKNTCSQPQAICDNTGKCACLPGFSVSQDFSCKKAIGQVCDPKSKVNQCVAGTQCDRTGHCWQQPPEYCTGPVPYRYNNLDFVQRKCMSGTVCGERNPLCSIAHLEDCSGWKKHFCDYGFVCDTDSRCKLGGNRLRCSLDIDCVRGANCLEMKCTCNETIAAFDSFTTLCVPLQNRVGGSCSINGGCDDPNAECKGDICKCKAGFVPGHNLDCAFALGSNCTGNEKLCAEGLRCDAIAHQCKKTPGNACSKGTDCESRAECEHGICKLTVNSNCSGSNSGFCQEGTVCDSTLLLCKMDMSSHCNSTEECMEGASCSDNSNSTCVCDDELFELVSSVCVPKQGMADAACSDDSNCTAHNPICQNGVCTQLAPRPEGSSNTVIIIGIAVGTVCCVAAIVGTAGFFVHRIRKRKRASAGEQATEAEGHVQQVSPPQSPANSDQSAGTEDSSQYTTVSNVDNSSVIPDEWGSEPEHKTVQLFKALSS